MKRIRWTAIILFLLVCLTYSVGAEGELETLMADFRDEYGLNEDTFSLCYFDTVTGEEYRFNDTAFLFAASVYKLPLNLYYYEMERDGTLNASYQVGGVPLSRAHYQSLVWSDNDISHAMIYNLGNFRTYKEKMRKYFTMEDSEIASSYYTGNYYCAAMLLDALKYLYERREDFPEMLDYMGQSQPEEYFARYAGGTKVAHKYGFYYNEETKVLTVNDVGIIYGAHPFLLAVFTQNAKDGVEVVARACERLIQYNEEKAAESEPEPEPEPEREPERAPEPEPVRAAEPEMEAVPEPEAPPADADSNASQTPEEAPQGVVRRNIWWMILIAAFIFLLADAGAFFWMRRGGLERLEEKWDESDEEDEENNVV